MAQKRSPAWAKLRPISRPTNRLSSKWLRRAMNPSLSMPRTAAGFRSAARTWVGRSGGDRARIDVREVFAQLDEHAALRDAHAFTFRSLRRHRRRVRANRGRCVSPARSGADSPRFETEGGRPRPLAIRA